MVNTSKRRAGQERERERERERGGEEEREGRERGGYRDGCVTTLASVDIDIFSVSW